MHVERKKCIFLKRMKKDRCAYFEAHEKRQMWAMRRGHEKKIQFSLFGACISSHLFYIERKYIAEKNDKNDD